MSEFDDALIEHVPIDLRAEYEQTKPKPRPQPGPNPVPLDEREDSRVAVGPGVYRQGPEQPTEASTRSALEAAHQTWISMGSPEYGWAAEELQSRLADAFLMAKPDSDNERAIAELGVSLGQAQLLDQVADVFNAMANRVDMQTRGQTVLRELWTEAKLDPEVNEWLLANYSDDADYLAQIADGQLSVDQIKEDLAERRAAVEEMILANRRLDALAEENEEMLRSGPTLDESWMKNARAELEQAADRDTTVTDEEVQQRKERLLGAPEPERFPLEADEEVWRREGFVVDEEADAQRMRWGREAAEAEKESR